MTTLDDLAWELLHEVRLRGRLEAPEGHPADTLLAAGFVIRTRTLLVLTPAGRERHAAWALLPDGSEQHATARRVYEAFLPLNVEVLRLCSDWQVRPGGVPNDHADPRYDWAILDRLHGVDERAGPLVRRLSRAVPRFGAYRPRLAAARERVEAGEHEWFTSPRLDSYHTVWMLLHEDLLAAMGLERGGEPEP